MYSLILMTALTPGADVTPSVTYGAPLAYAAPVSYGCCGAVTAGCTGYPSSYGCSGYSCFGSSCYGSSHHGLFSGMRSGGGLFGSHKSCHGCGGGSGSCYGSGYSSCHGWGGCSGSCYGSGYGSGYGASSWGPPIGMPAYTLHGYGCAGGWGYGQPAIYGSPTSVYGNVTNVNPPPAAVIQPEMKKPEDTMKKPEDTTKKPMGANLKFKLPADAKLFVDGRLTNLVGTERSFTTPPLAAGQYFYEVKAELMVDGVAVIEEKRVVIEAGAELTEAFPKLFAAISGKTGTVAGK